jgi:argininosuccinate lyase
LVASAFSLEASDGPLLHTGMSLSDLAHTVMLVEAGVIPPAAGAGLLTALLDLHNIPANEFPFDPSRGDAYTNREYILRRKAPDSAGWLRAGRPRREASTIAYLLVLRERLLSLTGALLDVMSAILDLAKDNLQTLMPDYTYLQTAHPTTLAHYVLTFVSPMTRDLSRLRCAFERINLSPAGSGSTNGSRLPLDRARLAGLLGFDGIALHTRDAMWQPDGPIEVMGAVVAMLVNADRLVEDLQIWATAEFGMIELADRHSRVSVIMPQKKNPYSLAFVRGVAREMIGRFASVAAVGATPSGQVDNRIFVYGGVPAALKLTIQALKLLAGTVSGLTLKPAVMAQRAGRNYSGATDLADMIMLEYGLDSRTAHRIVSKAVGTAFVSQLPLTQEILDTASQAVIKRPLNLTDQTIAEVMKPENIINTRTGPGGAAPQSVEFMLNTYRVSLSEAQDWVGATQKRLAAAEKNLLKTAHKLAGFSGTAG